MLCWQQTRMLPLLSPTQPTRRQSIAPATQISAAQQHRHLSCSVGVLQCCLSIAGRQWASGHQSIRQLFAD